MKILSAWVLIEPDLTPVSPLLVGTPAVELPSQGIVMAIGPDVVDIAPMDRVMFPRWAPQRVNDLLLIKEGTIDLIVPPGNHASYSDEL